MKFDKLSYREPRRRSFRRVERYGSEYDGTTLQGGTSPRSRQRVSIQAPDIYTSQGATNFVTVSAHPLFSAVTAVTALSPGLPLDMEYPEWDVCILMGHACFWQPERVYAYAIVIVVGCRGYMLYPARRTVFEAILYDV